MEKILSSKAIVDSRKSQLQKDCESLKTLSKITPRLEVVLVGDNTASLLYIKNKEKLAKEIGIDFNVRSFPSTLTKSEFFAVVEKLNHDHKVHGAFIQLPLPLHLQDLDTSNLIRPEKDVDGFGDASLCDIYRNNLKRQDFRPFTPCTPKGVLTLLDEFNIDIKGKDITLIGKSLIVGRPLSLILQNRGATVTVCHSQTQDLQKHTLNADIVISAVGISNLLNKSHFKTDETQCIIDIGINTDSTGRLCGDVDFNSVLDHVRCITPVPGGVGPMTVLSLMENTVEAAKRSLSKSK